MTDRIHQAIDRIAALLDLAASVIFIAILLRLYHWIGPLFEGGLK